MRLKEIKLKDHSFIHTLTNNPTVYRYIRNGRPWDDQKITRFINKCIDDQQKTFQERKNFNYIIQEKNKDSIGVVGVSYKNKKYSLTVFILPKYQGKGYFSRSLNLLLRRLRRYKPELEYIYAQTHTNNKRMNQILSDKFEYKRRYSIGKISVNEFKIYI